MAMEFWFYQEVFHSLLYADRLIMKIRVPNRPNFFEGLGVVASFFGDQGYLISF